MSIRVDIDEEDDPGRIGAPAEEGPRLSPAAALAVFSLALGGLGAWLAVGSVPAAGVGAMAAAVSSVAGLWCSLQVGRPVAEGWLLGLLLGPFGVIAAAVLPRRP